MANIQWHNADFLWDDNLHLWNDVVEEVIEEIESGGRNWRRRDKDKKKRRQVIRLVMYRKNIKVYDEKKEVQNIEHHIEDIKLIAEELKKNVQIIHG